MQVLQADGSPMDPVKQRTDGDFVLVNTDDYSDQTDASGAAIPDLEVTSQTSWADPNLVEVDIPSLPSSVGGTYSLNWSSPNIRVWSTRYKSAQLSSGYSFNATSMQRVYVESTGITEQMGTDSLSLSWLSALAHAAIVNGVQRAAFNGMQAVGPQNVPAGGQYTYKIEGVKAESTKWTATGGTVTPDPKVNSRATVAWSTSATGGFIGTVDCTVDSVPLTPRQIHVVEVTVTSPSNGAAFVENGYSSAVTNKLPNGSNTLQERELVQAGQPANGVPGIEYKATVTLSGPTVTGVGPNVGVDQISVGFVQDVVKFSNIGTYATAKNPQGQVGATLTSAVGAMVAKHPIIDQAKNSKGAWYNSASSQMYFAGFKSASGGGKAVLSHDFDGEDSPGNGPPLTYQEDDAIPPAPAHALLSLMTYEEDFELDICAQTAQASLNIYVRRATASWSFFATGGQGGPATNFQFRSKMANGLPVTGVVLPNPMAWTSVPPGNWQPSQTSGKTMNDLTGRPERFTRS